MGDPRRTRKKYSSPIHPWEKSRIDKESEIKKKYALNNKKEIWKMDSMLKGFKEQVKKLESLDTKQAEKEKKQLLAKLMAYGLLEEENMETILTLQLEDIMERRLQTIIFKKNLAKSMKQARQFVTHGHIQVGEVVVKSPSYIVLKREEDKVKFKDKSSLADPENPERQIAKPVEEKEETKKVESKKSEKTKEKKTEEKKKEPKVKKEGEAEKAQVKEKEDKSKATKEVKKKEEKDVKESK